MKGKGGKKLLEQKLVWSSPNLKRINNIKPQGHSLSLTVPQGSSKPDGMASGVP